MHPSSLLSEGCLIICLCPRLLGRSFRRDVWTKVTILLPSAHSINGNFVSLCRGEHSCTRVWMGVCGGENKADAIPQMREDSRCIMKAGPIPPLADGNLKGSVNTVCEQKALSADIHIPCHQRPHMRGHAISSITFSLLQVFFFLLWQGGTEICLSPSDFFSQCAFNCSVAVMWEMCRTAWVWFVIQLMSALQYFSAWYNSIK